VISATPVRPSEVNPLLPAEIDTIVMHALAKGLDMRFQSAASFAAELRSIAAVLDVRSGDDAAGELIQLEEDRGGPVWIAVLLIAIVAATAVWYFL
jgi:hypothetical protein